MTIKLVIAVDQGNTIGWSDGRLAYPSLKQDMARFKELTTGHTVVMGFNTFKSLRRPAGLPNRKNIVVTRKNPLQARGLIGDGIDIITSLAYISQLDNRDRSRTIWICGGASVYDEAIDQNMVDEIHMTLVHGTSDGDIRLQNDLAAWKRFILTQQKRGKNWEPFLGSRQWDGDHETSYITLVKT